MNVKLVVLGGKHAGREISLPLTQFVIGRDPRCHLRPASSDVSRFHCAIATQSGLVQVRDLKSCNGTFVNGHRICGPVRVHDGDILQVGALRFQFLIHSLIGNEVIPAIGCNSDSGMAWLMRSPDASETVALDPSARTMVGNLRMQATGDGRTRWQVDRPHDEGGAVAGDFLLEYLNRRDTSAPT